MKKLLLLCALCGIFSFQAKADIETTDNITISELQSGEYGSFFTVSLEGSDTYYTAFEITLEFPEGLSVQLYEGELDVYRCDKSPLFKAGRNSTDHTVSPSFGQVGDRKLKVVCVSTKNKDFGATSGDLFDVYVTASPYMKPGESLIKSSDVFFVDNTTGQAINNVCAPVSFPIEIASERQIELNISATQQWNTCVLPFSTELPKGVKAFEGTTVEGDYLILKEATTLEAFTPYLLYAENGYNGTVEGTVSEDDYVTVANGGPLKGAIMPQQITEGYVLQDQGNGMMFYNVNNRNFTIPSGKCWVATGGNAQAIRIGFGETGIESMPAAPTTNQPIYTLDGKRVSTPQKGNVYIIGGKKALYLK